VSDSAPAGPGPSLWFLLRHELRLWYRRTFESQARRGLYAGLFVVAFFVLHGLAFSIVRALSYLPADLSPALMLPLLSVVALMMFTLVTAQALSGATRAFFERGSDLLMAAPVSPERLFAIRSVALVITTTAPFAVFVLPVAHMGVVVGGWAWLALYPVLFAMGVAGTAAGLVLALRLVGLLGPRLSRSAGQIVAVLIGTSLGFAIQYFNRLPMESKLSLVDDVMRSSSGQRDAWAMLSWTPGLAMSGDPLAILTLVAASLALFGFSIAFAGQRYARIRQDAMGLAERPLMRHRRRWSLTASPAAALRRKELRLLTRDPWILMPVLQRGIALVPVCLTLTGFQSRADVALSVAGPMLVIFAGKLSGGIGWLTLAAEEAPELVNTAPVPARAGRRAKLEAALLAAAALFAIPLLVVAWHSPEAAAWTTSGCVAATLAATVLALSEPTAGQRRTLNERFRNSVPFVVAELLVTTTLAVTTWLAIEHRFEGAAFAGLCSATILFAFVILMKPPKPGTRPSPLGVRPAQTLTRNPS
jgi:ABC-2 type transport system permease protein